MVLHQKRPRRYDAHILNIPDKANRILNVILIAIILIVIRIWHLTVIQYEDKIEEARKPRAKVVVEPAKRATIRDRFNLPLAINKMRYQAAVLYSQLSEIPAVSWEINAEGKRVKRFKRREYIVKLSQLLGRELEMDPDRIEDLIYSKAAFFHQIPFILKEEISEKEYYRLKMLEKDWPGIQVQRIPKRYYPRGRVGADIIGYMGAINRPEYDAIIQEIKLLEKILQEEESGEEPEFPAGMLSLSQVRNRLKELQEHAYTINDYVGKTGIEGMFEEELRGFHGKKSYYSDARGNFLRELPGAREPLSGHRLLLTISAELQEYAEQLLIQNEQMREGRYSSKEFGRSQPMLQQPWIKGGAIVAMDPNNGEVIALASYPRFDPNDFISSGSAAINKEKRSNILHWFENEAYLGEIWDQKRPLIREVYDDDAQMLSEEEKWLTWDQYLSFILPQDSSATIAVHRMDQLRHAATLQKEVELLLELSGSQDLYSAFNRLYQGDVEHVPYHSKTADAENLEAHFKQNAKPILELKKRLEPFLGEIKHSYDQVLVVDLYRLAMDGKKFSEDLLAQVGKQTLGSYRQASSAMIVITEAMKKKTKQLFHDLDFKQWRKEHEKEFLKEKRKEEKLSQRYPKPYLDYLDAKENEMFQVFWHDHFWDLLKVFFNGKIEKDRLKESLHPYEGAFAFWNEEISRNRHSLQAHYSVLKESLKGLSSLQAVEYLKTMRSFQELDRPLLGRYRHLRNSNGVQLEKHLASAFYPVYGFGYGRSQAYRQAAIQGSIFKLVTAYEALRQRYQQLVERGESLRKLNPLEMIDDAHRNGKSWFVGYQMNGEPIPQLYKGGRIPRSRAPNLGKIDISRALEISSNPYFSLLASDFMESPLDLAQAARAFSYGGRTGIDLPAEISGKVPTDIDQNRTGLYSLAIGQHSLVVTPLQTAVMLSTIANGGKVFKPKIVSMTAGRERRSSKDRIAHKDQFPYKESLALVGIQFPLFTSVENREQESLINRISEEVKREMFMPHVVRELLLNSMSQVVARSQAEGLAGLKKVYHKHPEAIQSLQDLKEDLVGKTSTSEVLENLNLDELGGTQMCTHVWFGGVAFDHDGKGRINKTFISKDSYGNPELVVVVYLKYGGFGKEAAPIAAQVVKKWREIQRKYAAPTVGIR